MQQQQQQHRKCANDSHITISFPNTTFRFTIFPVLYDRLRSQNTDIPRFFAIVLYRPIYSHPYDLSCATQPPSKCYKRRRAQILQLATTGEGKINKWLLIYHENYKKNCKINKWKMFIYTACPNKALKQDHLWPFYKDMVYN